MVTIAILTLKEPWSVLRDLRKQTYKDFEVILADKPGIVSAMTYALNKAQGEIFVRIDDDVTLPDTWLEELVKPFECESVGGVTGPTWVDEKLRGNRDSLKAAERPNWFLRWLFDGDPYAPAKIYNCGSVSYGSNFVEKFNFKERYEIDHLEGTNWAMRTELIKRVGGFDPAFDGVAEWFDSDVVYKVKKLGFQMVYNHTAALWHEVGIGGHFSERFEGLGRIKNWLRFHIRHSKFHYKKIIWLFMMGGYFLWRRFR